ncbi:MAG: helicase-related protein [Bacillota bacterium]
MLTEDQQRGLRSRQWELEYRTSSTVIDGRPLDILHDFYLPALSLANRYDRVAGYFRSSSLAAASQGFSSLIGRGGRMRLIVGADLEPADVQAILDGDQARLAARLCERLADATAWPSDVTSGVALLGWMVANGYLQVRVAFRLHMQTGQPVNWDSVEDGYMHEKWFILSDEYGQKIYGSGTLNESKTALMHNAENINLHCEWWGGTDAIRAQRAEKAFQALWDGQVAHMPVMPIPQAVEQRLLTLSKQAANLKEIDGTLVEEEQAAPTSMERLQFAVLRDAPRMPGGRWVGMYTAPVAPWPHQEVVARRLVETWPFSYLLCDEVGLGKTIEAGLAFRSLYLSGMAKRILVAAPASLTQQWLRQMKEKVLLSFGLASASPRIQHQYLHPSKESVLAGSLFEPNLTIVSTGLLARVERQDELKRAEPFDIALVDEAHAARRSNSTRGPGQQPRYVNLYRALQTGLRPKARALWMATATPMQLHPVEVCDLLALTNRVGAFQFDPSVTLEYYQLLRRLGEGARLSDAEWEFLRSSLLAIESEDPLFWQFVQRNVLDHSMRMLLRQWLQYHRTPGYSDLRHALRLLTRTAPLARVMFRHNRGLLEVYREKGELTENLAQRHVTLTPSKFSAQEERVYHQLEAYCRGLTEQMNRHQDQKTRQMLTFYLSFLRLRFSSSLFAINSTLQRRLQRVQATLRYQAWLEREDNEQEFDPEDDWDVDATDLGSVLLKNRTKGDLQWEESRLRDLLQEMSDLTSRPSKVQHVLSALDRRRNRADGRIDQVVIFTRFYDTLQDLVGWLRQADPQMLIGTYSGSGATVFDPLERRMRNVSREDVKQRFLREEIDVLVCTDAAAEGLNLQTASLLINFDMGWNPMKIEQRIGRIDRIGQRHSNIYILNLCYLDSLEEVVYARLLRRLEDANLVVGQQQLALLPVTQEDFARLADGSITQDELEECIKQRLQQQRDNAAVVETSATELYEIYRRARERQSDVNLPVRLEEVWQVLTGSEYLRKLGYTCKDCDRKLLARESDGTLFTIDRTLYERGLKEGGTLRFAAYGESEFDRLLNEVTEYELPPAARRLEVAAPGMPGLTVVGYAAAIRERSLVSVRLVTKMSELMGVELAEEVELSESDLDPLRQVLVALARKEFELAAAAHRIERDNIRSGKAQEMLSHLVAWALLQEKDNSGSKETRYSNVRRELEARLNEGRPLRAYTLPSRLLRPVKERILFKCEVPAVGERASMAVPPCLSTSALDTVSRLVENMERKSELRLHHVLTSLMREAERISNQI